MPCGANQGRSLTNRLELVTKSERNDREELERLHILVELGLLGDDVRLHRCICRSVDARRGIHGIGTNRSANTQG